MKRFDSIRLSFIGLGIFKTKSYTLGFQITYYGKGISFVLSLPRMELELWIEKN